MRQGTRSVIYCLLAVCFYCCKDQASSSPSQNDYEVLKTKVNELETRVDSLTVILKPPKAVKATSDKKKKNEKAYSSKSTIPKPATEEKNYKQQTASPQKSQSYTPTKKEKAYTTRVGAICCDGSRSYATGRGACSHHGGVCEWLYQ